MQGIRERLKWLRVRVAERLVWGLGYGIYRREYVVDAERRAVALVDYSRRSGHLTRAYHAGKRVQGDADALGTALRLAAVGLARGVPMPLRPLALGALVGFIGAAVLRGGARSW